VIGYDGHCILGSYYAPFSPTSSSRTVQPLGVYQLHGLACRPHSAGGLLSLDTVRGYLVEIGRATTNTTILNPYQAQAFLDATGLALDASPEAGGGSSIWLEGPD